MIRKYITQLLTEKGISTEHQFEIPSNGLFGNHIIHLDVLIEFLEQLPNHLQQQVRNTLIQIDYNNGDILHYLNHLTKGMVKVHFQDN